MFSRARALWLRGLEELSAEQSEQLVGFLDGGDCPDDVVILATGRKLDRRTALAKWLASRRAIEDLTLERDKRNGRLTARAKKALACERAELYGLRFTRAALERIVELSGEDEDQLIQEIDKVCLAAGSRRTIGVDVVEAVARDLGERRLYELSSALGRRQWGEAARLLDQLLEAGEHPLRIVATLSNYLALLIALRRIAVVLPPEARQDAKLFEQRYYGSLPAAVRKRVPKPYRAFHILAEAAAFESEELVRLHHRLLEVDLKLKSTRIDGRLLLSGLLASACAASP